MIKKLVYSWFLIPLSFLMISACDDTDSYEEDTVEDEIIEETEGAEDE